MTITTLVQLQAAAKRHAARPWTQRHWKNLPVGNNYAHRTSEGHVFTYTRKGTQRIYLAGPVAEQQLGNGYIQSCILPAAERKAN